MSSKRNRSTSPAQRPSKCIHTGTSGSRAHTAQDSLPTVSSVPPSSQEVIASPSAGLPNNGGPNDLVRGRPKYIVDALAQVATLSKVEVWDELETLWVEFEMSYGPLPPVSNIATTSTASAYSEIIGQQETFAGSHFKTAHRVFFLDQPRQARQLHQQTTWDKP